MTDKLKQDELDVVQDEQMMTEEELLELLGEIQEQPKTDFEFVYQPMELSEETLTEISNTSEFTEGVALGAKLAGLYSTLLSFGVDIGTASALTINQQTLEYNQKLQKVVNEGAKSQLTALKQQSL